MKTRCTGWSPSNFTLSVKGNSVQIIDGAGLIAARVGDDVSYSGYGTVCRRAVLSWRGTSPRATFPSPAPHNLAHL